MTDEYLRESWVEIDLAALKRNYEKVGALTEARVIPIVKADAYGHGAVPVVEALAECGAASFGVATLAEALELKAVFPQCEILLLGAAPMECSDIMVKNNIVPTIFRYDQARALSEEGVRQEKTITIHIKVDTGMGRIGFRTSEMDDIMKIAALPRVIIGGIYTHFAASDSLNQSFTKEQIQRFEDFCTVLEEKGLKIPVRHAANSGGILNAPAGHFDAVRPGIILYGLPPAPWLEKTLNVEPVMAWKTKITNLKTIQTGETVSYGCTFKAAYPTKVATIPVGYADGLRRSLSNCGEVLVQGKRATIIGRVCMDQAMIDVTHIPDLKIGDMVTLMGRDQDDAITATEIAKWLNTINYEVLCGVTKRVPRVYK